MKTVEFTIEKCNDTNLYVGIIPGISGAHSQGDSIENLLTNLKFVCDLLEINQMNLVGKFDNSVYKINV